MKFHLRKKRCRFVSARRIWLTGNAVGPGGRKNREMLRGKKTKMAKISPGGRGTVVSVNKRLMGKGWLIVLCVREEDAAHPLTRKKGNRLPELSQKGKRTNQPSKRGEGGIQKPSHR